MDELQFLVEKIVMEYLEIIISPLLCQRSRLGIVSASIHVLSIL